MARENIPDDLRRFILTSVPSVPYLEAMLLLRRERATDWTAPMLARRLYLPESRAGELLQSLRTAGVVEPRGEAAYGYQPAAALGDLLDRVDRLYAKDLVGVTDLIHSTVDRRALQFADAFRIRKDS